MHRPRPRRHEQPVPRWLLGLVLVAVPALLVAACGNDGGSSSATTEAPSVPEENLDDQTGRDAVVVQARDNTFLSQDVLISAGTEVTFENRGRNPHNVLPVEDGAFPAVETEDFQPGDEAAITFDEPGEYPYYCSLHGTETGGMVGTIVVRE